MSLYLLDTDIVSLLFRSTDKTTALHRRFEEIPGVVCENWTEEQEP